MDYGHILDISASGMDFQRLRLETIAANIANAQTSSPTFANLYQPSEAVATADFQQVLGQYALDGEQLTGVPEMRVESMSIPPRRVYDPDHPHANAEGFVFYPDVDMIDAMTSLMTATRAYEANVSAFNAAKTMALKALEIGR